MRSMLSITSTSASAANMAAGVTKRLWEMTDIVDVIDDWEAKQVRQTRLAA